MRYLSTAALDCMSLISNLSLLFKEFQPLSFGFVLLRHITLDKRHSLRGETRAIEQEPHGHTPAPHPVSGTRPRVLPTPVGSGQV